jgi:nitrite reductase (NADH) large subunit
VPLVTEILKAELRRAGVAVNNHLCEHFPHSRQELFHLVKIKQTRTFEVAIATFGHGAGCEICKPAMASILASIFNEHVVKKEHVGLQDTNDRFLANIQRDGTYSVVPRVAGGEITPRQLIVLGEVAEKYGLYTKITGGQRIDLFGARVEQLPIIWKELIAAGFESGHAYGKALRTVKSCVGSTWCRYGVQDSVAFAIRVENRYKGLRSPHKLKSAVSGCARECAEAQSKDFGIIATEKGYNLYVCGNGGMKPQHALLLAQDLDEETLLRYVDRFLMFYVRTADRLERTAPWFNKLEGGIDYLKGVIVDDSLGLAAELEAEMQHIVDTYQDEWKTAVEDPTIARRFRSFVNTEVADPSIVRVPLRRQHRPATWQEKTEKTPELRAATGVVVPHETSNGARA